MTQFSAIGHKVPRIDAGQIVTGVAQYSVDISLPGMLTGHILRSHVPHTRIRSINVEKAMALPGVLAVVTGDDTLQRKYGYRESGVQHLRHVGNRFCVNKGDPASSASKL